MAVYSAVYLGQLFLTSKGMKRPVAREPLRLPRLGLVLKIVGIALFIFSQLFANEISDWLFDRKLTANAEVMDGSMQESVVAFVLSWGGAVLLYAGYRFGLRGASSVVKDDTRAPAVYLRSFGDDGKNNLNPDTLSAKLLGLRVWGLLEKLGPIANLYPPRLIKLVLGSAVDTAEEQLASFFRKQGSFVAIGKPGEVLATGGAERMYVSHETWKDTVLGLVDRSSTVVLQPARTEGVWWEIETCIDRVPIGRLLFSFAAFEKSPQAYEEFRLRLEDLSNWSLPRTLGAAQFIWIDPQGRAIALGNRYRTPLLWPLLGVGLDLEATLWPFLNHVYPKEFSGAPQRERPVLFAAGKVTAIIIWPVLIFGGPMLLNHVQEVGRHFKSMDLTTAAGHRGRGAEYVLKLPTDWEEMAQPPGCDSVWASPKELAVVSVEIADQISGNTDDLARIALHNINHVFSEPVKELNRRRVIRNGKEWLEIEVHRKLAASAFTQYQVLNFYTGAEGKYILCISAAKVNVELFPHRREILRRIADGFQLPPPKLALQKPDERPSVPLADSRYTVKLAEGWHPAPAEVQETFPVGHLFQYGEAGDAFFGVIMEPPIADQLTPQNVAESFIGQVESRGAKDVQASDIKTFRVGTREWIQFRLRAKISGVDLTYLYAVYLGSDATCTTISWTLTNQLKTNEPHIRKIFAGLQLSFD